MARLLSDGPGLDSWDTAHLDAWLAELPCWVAVAATLPGAPARLDSRSCGVASLADMATGCRRRMDPADPEDVARLQRYEALLADGLQWLVSVRRPTAPGDDGAADQRIDLAVSDDGVRYSVYRGRWNARVLTEADAEVIAYQQGGGLADA